MKYICLGYLDPKKWASLSESERNAMIDECMAYDDILRRDGHFAGGEALQGPETAMTLRFENGKVTMTDGPYAETKEQLGGILILEARDLNEAIQLMSRHPGVRMGPFEIRPAGDLAELVEASLTAAADPGQGSACIARLYFGIGSAEGQKRAVEMGSPRKKALIA
jgi:hypothetical protein